VRRVDHSDVDDLLDVQVGGAGPAPGWYADPGGSGGVRWWDGVAWTATVRALPDPVVPAQPEPVPPAPVAQYVPQPFGEAEPYAGDPRFGGVPAGTSPAGPQPPHGVASPAHHAARRGPAVGLPRWAVAAGAAVLVVVAVVGVKVLAGGGSPGSAGSGPTGALGGGDARANVAAMKADVRSVADAEETEFTDHQAYVAAASTGNRLAVGSQLVPMSAIGATVTVALSPNRNAYCIVARRAPLGGGPTQVVVYVSSAGGLQAESVTACPATF
jgi:hypothetical protein